MIRKTKNGQLILNGVAPYRHELKTILHYISQGIDVEVIPKSNLPGVHTADIIMLGQEWEMKSPKGSGRWMINNILQDASKQSANIIVDLRRVQRAEQRCLAELETSFYSIKRLKHLKIITKRQKDIDFIKK